MAHRYMLRLLDLQCLRGSACLHYSPELRVLLSPEQEPDNVKVIYVAGAPVVGQHRHERKQQPHHAVLRSRPLPLLFMLQDRGTIASTYSCAGKGGGSAGEGKRMLQVASPAG